eukprot:TRINITY_DN2249_c0_g1_i1.p1 TRINITY_DN2249_c0_g1~~TRINITY_DN2249_c0_g1_i1.p1  ORF type:complete len:489 (+),score=113.63 TRINITY_DN2249_c0_g1_i1:14-1480(+)
MSSAYGTINSRSAAFSAIGEDDSTIGEIEDGLTTAVNYVIDTPEKETRIEFGGFYFPQRMVTVILTFWATALVYLLRSNLSVAQETLAKELKWSGGFTTLALAAFYAGYIFTQIPGGWLAHRIGSKITLGVGIFGSSLSTFLLPFFADIGPLFLLCRFCTGIFEAVTYPCVNDIASKWFPRRENSLLLGIVNIGASIGTIVAYASTSPIVNSLGWPWVFWIGGCSGLLWCAAWMLLFTSDPKDNQWVSPYELELMLEGKEEVKNKPVPWRKIITCVPFWGIVTTSFCGAWGFYTLLSWLPQYFTSILHFDITKPSLFLYLPFALSIPTAIICAKSADYIINRGRIVHFQETVRVKSSIIASLPPSELESLLKPHRNQDFVKIIGIHRVEFVRKLFQSISMFVPAIFLGLITTNPSTVVTIIYLNIAQTAVACASGGVTVNYLDIAPEFANVLYGISNTFSTLAGLLSTLICGSILGNDIPNAPGVTSL